MKTRQHFLFAFLFIISFSSFGQNHISQTKTENGFTYETVTNDPANARIYTLKNGLKVYLSVYKETPRIQTYIAVRAGSKNDPADATGLAHYLEHILFKGTSRIGTSDWEKEKSELTKIEDIYEVYRKTTDATQRTLLYKLIDSMSVLASTYSIANEYDKLLNSIGAEGTNAYTFLEQTVYVNDIPSNQVEKWAEIESERFGEVVPRLFHTELEAVYEEKNKGLDQDRRKIWETTMASLFQKHTYGTQTTIGTVEHLKNPSIKEIKKYFYKYYVPNNIAICMSGDLDFNKTIAAIDKYFSKLVPKEVPAFDNKAESPINKPIEKIVMGPDAESVSIAFRLFGPDKSNAGKPEALSKTSMTDLCKSKMLSMILTNGQAGLIDLNLNQKQLILSGYAYDSPFNDYSIFGLGGKPREGQSLEQVKDFLLAQLDSVKQGKFDEWLVKAVVYDYKISKMREYESNRSRADAFVDAFISKKDWAEYISDVDEIGRLTKKDIVDFANKNFSNNYVVVYKKKGADTTIQKVPKPKISAVNLNRDKQSLFYLNLLAKSSDPIQPVFLDYTKDMSIVNKKNNIDVRYKKNVENQLFSLSFIWDIGREDNPKYGVAADYLDYLGTTQYSAEQLKKEFYKLGCSYAISAGSDRIMMNLSGLQENFVPAVKLFESLINGAKTDEKALKDMIAGILKQRADNKLNKDIILRSALTSYVKYGSKNPFTNILSKTELEQLQAKELVELIKGLKNIKHRALFYGPMELTDLTKKLTDLHRKDGEIKTATDVDKFTFQDISENKVYFVNYDMVQAEVVFLSKSVTFDKTLAPTVSLFNEYFGGSMGSLVFQEMRESRALAYSVRSKYDNATKKEDPNYINSYIGTQADKLTEAVDGLSDLIDNMPKSDFLFENAKTSLIESISTQRITKSSILMNYEASSKLGLDYDIRKDIYDKDKMATFEDIKLFQEKYLKGQKKAILIIGSRDKLDLKKLEKYGKVTELKTEQIFGY